MVQLDFRGNREGPSLSLLPNLQPKNTKPARLERDSTDARDERRGPKRRAKGGPRGWGITGPCSEAVGPIPVGRTNLGPQRGHTALAPSAPRKVHQPSTEDYQSHVKRIPAPPRIRRSGPIQTPMISVGEERRTHQTNGPTHFSAYLSKKKHAGSRMEG